MGCCDYRRRGLVMAVIRKVFRFMFAPLFEPRFYVLAGVGMFLCFSVALSQDRFTLTSGNTKRVITRQDEPVLYWGTLATLVSFGVVCFGGGIYFTRRTRRG
jgi:hypothetical protein